MPAAVPTSTMEVSESPVTVPVLASVTVGSFLGFFGAVVTNRRMGDVTNRRMGDVTHTPIVGDGKADAAHNSFSPLLSLGSGEGLYFGER